MTEATRKQRAIVSVKHYALEQDQSAEFNVQDYLVKIDAFDGAPSLIPYTCQLDVYHGGSWVSFQRMQLQPGEEGLRSIGDESILVFAERDGRCRFQRIKVEQVLYDSNFYPGGPK